MFGRRASALAVFALLAANCPAADPPDFRGFWKLSLQQSDLKSIPEPISAAMLISQSGNLVECFRYTNGRRAEKDCSFTIGSAAAWSDYTRHIATRAESAGDGVNVSNDIDSPAGRYTTREHWALSNGDDQLTIIRETLTATGGDKAVIVYRRATIPPTPHAPNPIPPTTEIRVPAGTVVRLRVETPVEKKKKPLGQRVELTAAASVLVANRVAIPFGAVVTGTIADRREANLGKGAYLRVDSLTIPNVTVKDSAPATPNAGIAAILFEHGPSTGLAKGVQIEMTLARELVLTERSPGGSPSPAPPR